MEVVVRAGTILAYRVFEVADEIRLREAEARLAALGPRRLRFARVAPRHIQMSDPPVDVNLGAAAVALPEGALGAEVTARVYDYGAISVCISVQTLGWPWSRLREVGRTLTQTSILDALATEKMRGLRDLIAPALVEPHESPISEDYCVYFITAFDDGRAAPDLASDVDVAALLLSEEDGGRLSPSVRESALAQPLSYYRDDLAIVDWSAALVVEPSGVRDVPDVLEYATSQLLELRFYDDLLDRELDQVYDRVALGTRAWNPFLPNAFPQLSRYLTSLLVEVTDITERVDNSLKFIDDLYLAKVYERAAARFRIAHWQASVQRKLALVQSVHQVVQSRIQASRSLLLELAIVLLIVTEIVMTLVKIK